MNQAFLIEGAVAALGGLALGLAFFGGLRMTVAAMTRVRRPALLFVASLAVRMAIALPGFYLLGGGVWYRYLLALAGFLVSRMCVVRLWPEPTRDAAA